MAKYGIDNFIYEVMAVCLTSEDANETEKILIEQYNSRNKDYGYNIAPGGNEVWNRGLSAEQQPMYGKHHSEESKQKISESNTGKVKPPHTNEWKQQCSEWLTNRLVTDETKQKIGNFSKNRIRNANEKERLKTLFKGKKHSEESKRKISEANLGKVISEECKRKLTIKNSGENSNIKEIKNKIKVYALFS